MVGFLFHHFHNVHISGVSNGIIALMSVRFIWRPFFMKLGKVFPLVKIRDRIVTQIKGHIRCRYKEHDSSTNNSLQLLMRASAIDIY